MKMLVVYLLVCVMMALTTATGESDVVKRYASCPERWIEFRDRCYAFDSRVKTWAQAEEFCQGYPGGHMASVRNTEDLLNIQHAIEKWTAGKSPVTWIGGSDAEQDGTWLWSDGLFFKFANWAPGQPDYRGKCLTMNNGVERKLDDKPCSDYYPSVCEVKK